MRKLLLISTVLLLANCEKKNETQKTLETTSSATEKQPSEEEMMLEATRIADSAANAIDYEAEISVSGENPKVAKAKKILNEANSYVKKGILKEMSDDAVNAKINPLMEEYQKLLSQLHGADKEHVENYRIAEINKVIDLKVAHDNK